MKNCFDGVRGKLGFGCMRLPMLEDKVDTEKFSAMVDAFIDAGFNYFDTAKGYVRGLSESALKACLTSRYPRDKYLIADKLSSPHFKTEDEIRPIFEGQLEALGVDYIDYYLMHAQDKGNFEKYKSCRAYETALELLREGKIRHFGISFHDTADLLETILTEYPEIEFVQIQLNYADYEDPSVQSRLCLETCTRHGKPVIVMEPVKGGTLVRLPDTATDIFKSLGNMSPASYAIRFAAGCGGVAVVLSGMGDIDMVLDNTGYMRDFKPLSDVELDAVARVLDIIKGAGAIPCTDCKYCMELCPKNIAIPALFACLNTKRSFNYWNADYYYSIHTDGRGKAVDCIGCGRCEGVCPQHLPIRKLLGEVASEFEKKEK